LRRAGWCQRAAKGHGAIVPPKERTRAARASNAAATGPTHVALRLAASERRRRSPFAWQAREIKSHVDKLIDGHVTASEQGDDAGRARIEDQLRRIYAATLGVDPMKRRRLALMDRLDRVALGYGDNVSALVRILSPAYRGVSDRDLAPVLAVWGSRPGAKQGGDVSKWIALSRVLAKRWGDGTRPATLEREYRDARSKRNRGR
jgi:hypothetical protein